MAPVSDPAGESLSVDVRMDQWYKEKQPEVNRQFEEIERDLLAKLGQKVIDSLHQRPNDLQAIVRLVGGTNNSISDYKKLLEEGLRLEALDFETELLTVRLRHPDEPDPGQIVLERLQAVPNPPEFHTEYCSPLLMETLLWEGSKCLPDAHRTKIEYDFPARVEALLDFHAIAFHADVNVMKELYDDDGIRDKETKKEILGNHKAKMEGLMKAFAKEISVSWANLEQERRRDKGRGQYSSFHPVPEKFSGTDGRRNQEQQGNRGVHWASSSANHTADITKINSVTAQRGRGILKNPSAMNSEPYGGKSSRFYSPPSISERSDESSSIPSFFVDKIMGEDDIEYLDPAARYINRTLPPRVTNAPGPARSGGRVSGWRSNNTHTVRR
ncbi:hypothetical protein C8J57DRAFT_1313080 [Mycena rebaudengoi]|nr:hypothetical protein C8J57DRAFT_1313080 [Mycena rebaudengoi]